MPLLDLAIFWAGCRRHTWHVFLVESVVDFILVLEPMIACWAALLFIVFGLAFTPHLLTCLLSLDALELFIFFGHIVAFPSALLLASCERHTSMRACAAISIQRSSSRTDTAS